MSVNRISNDGRNRISGQTPQNTVTGVAVQPGFVMIPPMFVPGNVSQQANWILHLYRTAYDQARIAVAARERIRNFRFNWN